MPLPDMTNTVNYFSQPYVFEKIVGSTTDEDTGVVTDDISTINTTATIVPAKLRDLQKEDIDYSLKYIKAHTTNIDNYFNSTVVYKGDTYIIISQGSWSEYGYIKMIGQEIK